MAIEGKELLDYACTKFQNEAYDEALEAFVLAYCKGYEREWVLENVYNCYMAGNEEEFRNAYEAVCGANGVLYEDCTLDFIPYKDGAYYMFDKETQQFQGMFAMRELEETETPAVFQTVEFSGILLEMDGDWSAQKAILKEAKERLIFVVSHDVKRCVSFYKLPELSDYLRNVRIFADRQELQAYFHLHTAVYLPKIICGDNLAQIELKRMMDEEHKYRLTSEGRDASNVLLTIGIPTCDRGNIVIRRLEHLLQLEYDAEIEICISKNGTKLYQEEYEEISRIRDARVVYFDHGKELKAYVNWEYVVEMAHGKYALFVSDEDDVILEAIEHYLKLLQTHPNLSLVRAKTVCQYEFMKERIYAKKGLEAFQNSFLAQNYLSGLIVRRKDFVEEQVLELDRFCDNQFYVFYPHEWWCALLSRRGDYMQEPVCLIDEQASVRQEQIRRLGELDGKTEEQIQTECTSLPPYATYEARLEQFRGQLDFVKWFMGDNSEGLFEGIQKAMGKTGWLLKMARVYGYKKDEYPLFMDQFFRMCMETIHEVSLNDEQRMKLLEWAQYIKAAFAACDKK